MAADVNHFNDPKTLFGRLRSACADEWDKYCNHEFVQRIGDATLGNDIRHPDDRNW